MDRLDRIENIARILDMAKEENGKSIKRLTQPETPECYFLVSYLVETGMLQEVNKPTIRRRDPPKKKRGNYKTTSKGHKLLEKLRKLYSLVGWSLE